MAIKYKWLAELLRQQIKKNTEKGIHQLPSENELCKKYHVSRQTVRQSLSILEAEKLIVKKQGQGSFITGLSADHKKNIIRVMITNDQDYTYPQLIHDIQNTFSQNSFETAIHITDNLICRERIFLKQFLADPPRGLIIEPIRSALPNPNLDLYNLLKKKGCQLLFIDNYYPGLNGCLYLKTADYAGSVSVTNYLLSANHVHIGGVFLSDALNSHERYLGFMETMQNHNITIMDHQILWISSDDLKELRAGHTIPLFEAYLRRNTEAAEALLSSQQPVNTAYLCCSSEAAYALCQCMHQTLGQFPDKTEIAVFDHTYLNHYRKKRFITMQPERTACGKVAADMMLRKLKGLPVLSQEIPFIITDSTG